MTFSAFTAILAEIAEMLNMELRKIIMNMTKDMVEIDFEVYKEIVARLETPEMTGNEVLRKLLGLKPLVTSGIQSKNGFQNSAEIGWAWKGVILPHGTELRAEYNGQLYYAKIQNGKIIYNDASYTAPSTVATAVTGNAVNGWNFWECRVPGKSNWIPINKFRKTKIQSN